MGDYLLEGRGVSIAFGGVQAVRDVDFGVPEGVIYGIIGPNGAGKTTLLNGISGLVALSGGQILYEGRRISGVKKPHQIARLGIGRTFQVARPFDGLTVKENVTVGAVFAGKRGRKAAEVQSVVEEVMEFVGNKDKADSLVPDLPVAQRKRVELARAIAIQPKLLLLDEVMAGLNQREIEAVMAMVRQIRERGTTIVMIEHIMKAVMGLCDTVMVLRSGENICVGTPGEVCNDDQVIAAYLGDRYVKQRNSIGGDDRAQG
jgi:branched-chain amino acid transport system ATP-binding protein